MNMRSKKKVEASATLAKLLASAVVLVGAFAGQQAVAGIANTKHNLGKNTLGNSGGNKVTSGTEEICVFCHTPHGSNTGVTAPLWNKAIPSSTYTVYSSTTFDGSILTEGGKPVGSVSLACLSCHDGTQAMDSMINAPGSNGYNAAGPSQGFTFSEGAKLQDIGRVTNLGTDLSNDHPIGMPYCGGSSVSAATYTGGTSGNCNDQDFKDAIYNSTAKYWFVDNNGDSKRQKTDMILYTRSDGGTLKPYVECASCHDPHVESKGEAGAPQVAFLRVSQSGSGVCLACHTK